MDDNLFYEKMDLSDRELSLLNGEYRKRKKSSTVMWLLWLFTGGFGGHRFYLGDAFQGVFHICSVGLAFVLMNAWTAYVADTVSTVESMMIYSAKGTLFFFIPFFFALFDAFFAGRRLRRINTAIEARLIDQILNARRPASTTDRVAP